MSPLDVIRGWMSDGSIAWAGLAAEVLVASTRGSPHTTTSPRSTCSSTSC